MPLAANHLASTARGVALHVDDAYRLLGLTIVLQTIGYFWIRKVIKIEV